MLGLLLSMTIGAATLNSRDGGYDFRQAGVTKMQIRPGGVLRLGAFPTSSLPECSDGSLVWDSTTGSVKYCANSAWTTLGSAPGGDGLTQAQLMVRTRTAFGGF